MHSPSPLSATAVTRVGAAAEPRMGTDHAGLIGRSLGPYFITRHLGTGGMGAVFLAEHSGLDRKVALKVLMADKTGEPFALERFHREARAAAALDHPHIVRLFDMGAADGLHYLVMEFVEGTDLQTRLDQSGPTPFAEAVAFVAQAAAGLQHAHERGFVHRDVKPANLILAADGTVKVLDMGLARSIHDRAADRLTQLIPGECIAGTADYLSPEQALNAPLDARTDVYSLGATFYALLTGRPPFEGTTVQKLTQVQFKDTARVDEQPDVRVPKELAGVVARMMAKRPADRYQSATEVIGALARWLPLPILEALVPDAQTRAAFLNPLRRRRLAWALAAIGFVCVAVLLAVVLLAAAPTTPVEPVLEPPAPAALEPTELRAKLVTLDGHQAMVNDLAYSPDGARLGSIDTAGRLVIWDARTGRPLHAPPRPTPTACTWVCASGPGGHVFTGGDNQPVLAYDWETGAKVREYAPHAKTVTGLAVSPDGARLAVSGGHVDVAVFDLATGAELQRFGAGAKLVWAVAYSADGSKIAAGTSRGDSADGEFRVIVWSAADGKELHRFAGHAGAVRTVAFRPDGRVLASGAFDGTVRLWDLDTGKPVREFTAHEGFVERVFFLADGKRLVTCGGPGPGQEPKDEGGAVKIWDAETGRQLRVWRGANWSGLVSLLPSKDGQLLAAGGRNTLIRLWHVNLEP